MKLLITGASGQLARQVVERLLDDGPPERLILVSRDPSSLGTLARQGADVRYGDFADAESLRTAFAGAARMLLVSISDLTDRGRLQSRAIDAAVAAGVGHIIYTSGLAPEPPNPAVVAPSHYQTEQHLKSSGSSWTILRNSLYAEYQAGEAAQSAATGKLIHNRGAGKVAYISRVDCAAAAAAVLASSERRNETYDITGPAALDARDLADLYTELSGKRVEATALDDEAFKSLLVGDATDDDHLKYGVELVASFGRAIRENFMSSCTDHVLELTGREPKSLRAVLAAALHGHSG